MVGPHRPDSDVGRPIHNWGFLFERTKPRSIMVNRFGKRFVNEAPRQA